MARQAKAGKRGRGRTAARDGVPAELVPDIDARPVETPRGRFALNDPVLPAWVERNALASGGYPYSDEMKRKDYEAELTALQIELIKLQHHIGATGHRLIVVFEGRDAAGKGGSIFAIRQYLNPRTARMVALPKPTERERGQWYFQRYAEHLPTTGEIVLFDRSWYNRGGVERVMGFCTEAEFREFLQQAPGFESMLTEAGITLIKFWLEIGREMQLKQFHQRRHDPLKIWKLSPIDYAAMAKWDAYTEARDSTITATHKKKTPWTVVLSNDKRRARLAAIRHILGSVDYAGRDDAVVAVPDKTILGGPALIDIRPART